MKQLLSFLLLVLVFSTNMALGDYRDSVDDVDMTYQRYETYRIMTMGGEGPLNVIGWGCTGKLVFVNHYLKQDGTRFAPFLIQPGAVTEFTEACQKAHGKVRYGLLVNKNPRGEKYLMYQLLCSERLPQIFDPKECGF